MCQGHRQCTNRLRSGLLLVAQAVDLSLHRLIRPLMLLRFGERLRQDRHGVLAAMRDCNAFLACEGVGKEVVWDEA